VLQSGVHATLAGVALRREPAAHLKGRPLYFYVGDMNGSVQSAPLKCEDWNEGTPNQVAVARIATTQPRLHFIAGPDKRRPACPSLGSTCQLRAFLVPGDEVLVNVTEQGSYVCATFKAENGIMTRGLLPRVALQVASPAQISAQRWEGKSVHLL
jgi:hypothetical protein